MKFQSKLFETLVQGGFIKKEHLEEVKNRMEDREEGLINAVVKIGKSNYTKIAEYLAKKYFLPILDIETFNINDVMDSDLKFIEETMMLPLRKVNNTLYLATSDPTSKQVDDIKFNVGANNVVRLIVEEGKLYRYIESYMQTKGHKVGSVKLMADLADEDVDDLLLADDIEDNDVTNNPLVKYVNNILTNAIKQGVSDIHFEPFENNIVIRYRIDGELREISRLKNTHKDTMISRIKIMSRMDISERRVPQDGRIKFDLDRRKIDFRVSSLPTIWGEKIVMRILDSSIESLDINRLGYNDYQKKLLLEAIDRPFGMVLVTGPTGSGKTLSLYSCIKLLNTEDVNICTAEDPVEINLPGINQVNMNVKAGLNFENTLKAFLRQDPDIILVGEIRDIETAETAVKASQTGHLVMSTLHTNDAPQTLTRLNQMGIKPFNIASSVILITAQRLVRRLCEHCKKKVEIPKKILIESGYNESELEYYNDSNGWVTYGPSEKGCDECNSGYKGRVGIYQVMPITEEIKKIILNEGTEIEIAEQAEKEGVIDMRRSGLDKVKEGITSLEEVLATTNE